MADCIHITEFRRIVEVELEEFIVCSHGLNALLGILADKVKDVFNLELVFVKSATNMVYPGDTKVREMVKPISDALMDIQNFRDSNRHEESLFNHLSTISDSIFALNWIVYAEAPGKYIREMKDAGIYYGNRVLSTYRSNDQHVNWISKWTKVLTLLEDYVKRYHTRGFSWGAAVTGTVNTANPPPAPPPPAPAVHTYAGDTDRQALFAQITSQGANIAQSLKPTKDRVQATGSAGTHSRVPAATSAVPIHPPKLQLEGRKWLVEYQRNNHALVIETTNMAESVSMFKCEEVGLEIRSKLNGVIIDNVKKSTVALKDIISSVELIRCSDVKLQCNGNTPLISLDKCESIQLFLTENSLAVEIITSNCSALNVCILEPSGNYVEWPVPEQIRTVISKGKKLESSVLDRV